VKIGYEKQLFPVLDFITRSRIGVLPRTEVHRRGLWHEGVQAFIVRVDRTGTLQTLVQERSRHTDISARKIDQSLATQAQVGDNGDLDTTFKRGLRDEYGICEDEVRYVRVGAEGWLRVSKRYREDLTLYNREFVSLFLAQPVDPFAIIQPVSLKVERVYWQNWDDFVRSVQSHPQDYTKTSRFYVLNQPLRQSIQQQIKRFLERKPLRPFPFARSGYFSYASGPDIFINNRAFGNATVEIMEVEGRACRVYFRAVRSFDIYDSETQASLAVRMTSANGENHIWKDGSLSPTRRKASAASKIGMARIVGRFEKEIERMKRRISSPAQERQVEMSFLKIHSNLSRIRSRVDAGDFWLVNREAMRSSENLVFLASPGTYDPPHLSHIDLLLEALAYTSEARREQPAAYAGFLVPIGDNALGPEGKRAWKPDAIPTAQRHELTAALTALFSPLVQTSPPDLALPNAYGTENALRLVERYKGKFPGKIDFYVVAGSETFTRWHRNFAELLQKYQAIYGPGVGLRIITFDDPNFPVTETIAEHGYQNVDVINGFRNLGIHSVQVRETGEFDLLTAGVREIYSRIRSGA
jgi:hypothetical protein